MSHTKQITFFFLVYENNWSSLPFSNTLKDKVEEKRDSSLEILKKRYANGEISEEEFNKWKKI